MGVRVIAGSVRKPRADEAARPVCAANRIAAAAGVILLRAVVALCAANGDRFRPLISRVVFHGSEGPYSG